MLVKIYGVVTRSLTLFVFRLYLVEVLLNVIDVLLHFISILLQLLDQSAQLCGGSPATQTQRGRETVCYNHKLSLFPTLVITRDRYWSTVYNNNSHYIQSSDSLWKLFSQNVGTLIDITAVCIQFIRTVS